MQILSISNIPHDPNSGGGYVITGYIDGLRQKGHEVDAYGPEDYDFGHWRYGIRYRKMVAMAAFGVYQFFQKPYDLVEVWGGASWLLVLLLRWIASDTPVVHRSNGIEQHYTALKEKSSVIPGEHDRWFRVDLSRLYDIGLRASSAIVTVSAYDLLFLREGGYLPDDRLYAIDNPLPELYLGRSFSAKRSRRVGFCGSWIPKKGVPAMKEGMTAFLRQFPKWTFSVVGAKGEDVQSHFPEDVRDRVEVIPFLERDDLVKWYETIAIFILPSVAESFGLVAAEAMACGAALVATNTGYAHALSDGKEALILSELSATHLHVALARLAEDEHLRSQIARRGHRRVQSLAWEDAIDRIDSIYGQVRRVK